jgi:hypothetical protein
LRSSRNIDKMKQFKKEAGTLDMKKTIAVMALLLAHAGACLALSFTETFDTTAFRDPAGTTANWDTADSRAVLQRVSKFAQTVDVINWGGGVTAIDCSSSTKWLLGGLQGKINEFDGVNFIDHSSNLIGFGSSHLRAIKYNGSYWLIGGDGPSLNSWDGAGTWTDLKGNLINFMGAVNAIGYAQGKGYWLIGGSSGSLNAYYGTVPMTDLRNGLNFGIYDVKAVGFGNNYWLIAGSNGRIAKYDGVQFTDLTAQLYAAWGNAYYDINSLDWNGSYWVLGGGAGKIATYDGANFTGRNPGGTPFYTVWAVKWNGSYWIIGGCQGSSQTVLYTTPDANVTPYSEQANPPYFSIRPIWAIGSDMQAGAVNMIGGQNGKLMKRTGTYNSPVNSDLSTNAVDFGADGIMCAAYNGAYWLVGGAEGALNIYDGSAFTDIRGYLGWTSDTVLSVAWNNTDNYWLIGATNGKLAKYDGTNFYDRTAALGFGGNDVKTMKWNGAQWLIGGKNSSLARSADGDSFTPVDISAYFNTADAVNGIEWAQGLSKWFIGGGEGSLVTYDGFVFNDLKSALFSCLGGYYGVNAIKYDGGTKVRIGCSSAKMTDYEAGGFTNISSSLQNFGISDIRSMDYSAGLEMWIIGGTQGAINIASGPGAGVYSDESGNLVEFNQASVNVAVFNGEYWIIAGDSAKLNRYGLGYITPGWAYSTAIDQWFAGYACATLTAADTWNGQRIQYWLSANNGTTWLPVTSGTGVSFSGADNVDKLRWRAQLTAYDEIESPLIDTIIINFTRVNAPTYTMTATITKTWTCTPTFTATRTITQTVTPTYTRTGTPTRTFTVTTTGTRTYTWTATPTVTRTNTVSPTATGTMTVTLTSTATRTATMTVTPTVTRTSTATGTRTATLTTTRTGTATATATITQTGTITGTDTRTFTNTPTVTQTGTVTDTRTTTATCTITATVTRTVTDTETGTDTDTPTVTETCTATGTDTETGTDTDTPTITETSTATATVTQTVTDTETGTDTDTPTITETSTVTETGTATTTNTGTITDSVTATITETGTITETDTITETVTETSTDTASLTDTDTATVTETGTVTATVTQTMTDTETGTDTNTATITETGTITDTATQTMTDTNTATITETGTITDTATQTMTDTDTSTITETATITETGTITKTMSETMTDTLTATITGTGAITITETPSITETAALTWAGTITGTATITGIGTPTQTETAGAAPAQTATVTVQGPVSAGDDFILYPNPASAVLHVSYVMGADGALIVRIYNEAGMIAARYEERAAVGAHVSDVDISRLAPGVYFCLVDLFYDSGEREKLKMKKLLVVR